MRAAPTVSTARRIRHATRLTPSTLIEAAATAKASPAANRAPTITSPATTRTLPAPVSPVTTGTAEASAVTERVLPRGAGVGGRWGRPQRHGKRLRPGRVRVALGSKLLT